MTFKVTQGSLEKIIYQDRTYLGSIPDTYLTNDQTGETVSASDLQEAFEKAFPGASLKGLGEFELSAAFDRACEEINLDIVHAVARDDYRDQSRVALIAA